MMTGALEGIRLAASLAYTCATGRPRIGSGR